MHQLDTATSLSSSSPTIRNPSFTFHHGSHHGSRRQPCTLRLPPPSSVPETCRRRQTNTTTSRSFIPTAAPSQPSRLQQQHPQEPPTVPALRRQRLHCTRTASPSQQMNLHFRAVVAPVVDHGLFADIDIFGCLYKIGLHD